MSNWLFLRGAWDERTQNSIDTDDDMWLQLFDELTKKERREIYFRGNDSFFDSEYKNIRIFCGNENKVDYLREQFVFSRGGFDYYLPILKTAQFAYKIRYGAGKRYMPEPEIDYQLVLVDTEEQKAEVLAKYPKANVHLFIKPAARHFKPIDMEKEYDVCYIANGQQARFKGIEWVYNTAPKDLKILHLGYPSKFKPPANVTCRRVDRIDMPAEINKCRIGIVPYGSIDSCPRVIPEMLACGLPLIILDTVNFWREKYIYVDSDKDWFWAQVKTQLRQYDSIHSKSIFKYYKENLSIPIAANHIKELINYKTAACGIRYWQNLA